MAATHFNTPSWTGKALGAAVAFGFAPQDPLPAACWLAAGITLGHVLDVLGTHSAGPARAGRPQPSGDHRAGLRFTFAALGRLSAVSGNVRAQPLEEAERLMARLAFTPERRREALAWFDAGRENAFPFESLAVKGRQEFAAHPVLKELAMQALCRTAALAESPRATAELLTLGERVGWAPAELAKQSAALRTMPAGDPVERTPAEAPFVGLRAPGPPGRLQ